MRILSDSDVEVLDTYVQGHLTSMLFHSFINRKHASILIVGEPGVGKTNYAYYSIKTAYLLYLVYKAAGHNMLFAYRLNEEEKRRNLILAIDRLLYKNNYTVCFGRYCDAPDSIDMRLRDYVYVGAEDIENLSRLFDNRGELPEVLMLDDLLLKSTWLADSRLRLVYAFFKKLFAYHRAFARSIVFTAPSVHEYPKEIYSAVKHIKASTGYVEVTYTHYRIKPLRTVTLIEGRKEEYWRNVLDVAWSEKIPRKSIYAMPKWLEDTINERKRLIINELYERIRGKR